MQDHLTYTRESALNRSLLHALNAKDRTLARAVAVVAERHHLPAVQARAEAAARYLGGRHAY